MRKFRFTVENGVGDVAEVMVDVRDDRASGSYSGLAIRRAMRTLPDERPWRVTMIDELAAWADPPRPAPPLGGS